MRSSTARATDVIVVGGGPAGIAAAIASAKTGARTLLVEQLGYLGGMATAGLVNPFMVPKYKGKILIGGIFSEMIDLLRKKSACVDGELFGIAHIAFDADVLRSILIEMMKKNKVALMLGAKVKGVDVSSGRIKAIIVQGKSRGTRILAGMFVDATGNGDVACYAGSKYSVGTGREHLMQPATLNFNVGGIDIARMPSREKMDELFSWAKKNGEVNIPREKLLWFETTRPDQLHFNVTRIIGVDGTKAEDIIRAQEEGMKQVVEVFKFLKKHVPGFERSFISAVAEQVGFRETRRINGEYVLTKNDIVSGRIFKDTIALNNYPIDIHDPKGKGTVWMKLKKPYGIPLRCLIPGKPKNLLVAGRCISATHEALSSVRIMPVCMAMGQAAGAAAALSIKENTHPKDLDVELIKKELIEQGALIG